MLTTVEIWFASSPTSPKATYTGRLSTYAGSGSVKVVFPGGRPGFNARSVPYAMQTQFGRDVPALRA